MIIQIIVPKGVEKRLKKSTEEGIPEFEAKPNIIEILICWRVVRLKNQSVLNTQKGRNKTRNGAMLVGKLLNPFIRDKVT